MIGCSGLALPNFGLMHPEVRRDFRVFATMDENLSVWSIHPRMYAWNVCRFWHNMIA